MGYCSNREFFSYLYMLVVVVQSKPIPLMIIQLHTDAAEVLRQNRRLFEQNVAKSMRGGYVGSVYFERCLK